MYFIGIDLAWSEKNYSGIAILKRNKQKAELVCVDIVHTDDDIISYIKSNVKDKSGHIGIDAPLIVPNMEGRIYLHPGIRSYEMSSVKSS